MGAPARARLTLPAPRQDCGGIVLGWLTRLVVIGAVLGVIVFDGISIGVARMGVADDSASAAREAATTWQNTRDVNQAYATAVSTARQSDPLDDVPASLFSVDPATGTVTLTVRREASTIVVRLIGPIRAWADVSDHASTKAT